MSVVIAALTDAGHVVIGSDSRITYGGEFCMPSPEPKYKLYGKDVVGLTGNDDCLSRIDMGLKKPFRAQRPYFDIIKESLADMEQKEWSFELVICNQQNDILIMGQDLCELGPFPYVAVGHGFMIAMAVMDAVWKRTRKKTVTNVKRMVSEALKACAKYDATIAAPFFIDVV